MMKKLRYGNTNTFFLEGSNGGLLIDTDYAGTLSAFFRAIKAAGITVREISYVMATHYHPDHMGLISELMEMERINPYTVFGVETAEMLKMLRSLSEMGILSADLLGGLENVHLEKDLTADEVLETMIKRL